MLKQRSLIILYLSFTYILQALVLINSYVLENDLDPPPVLDEEFDMEPFEELENARDNVNFFDYKFPEDGKTLGPNYEENIHEVQEGFVSLNQKKIDYYRLMAKADEPSLMKAAQLRQDLANVYGEFEGVKDNGNPPSFLPDGNYYT